MAKSELLEVVDDLQDSNEAGEGPVTIGIDLGDRYSYCCLLSEEATVLAQGRIRTTAETRQRYFKDIPRCRIAIEAGTHSRWIFELLSSWGHEVIVANTGAIPLVWRIIERAMKRTQRCLRASRVPIPSFFLPFKAGEDRATKMWFA